VVLIFKFREDALLYFFHSQDHGACVLEARTSGKNGFGKPKYFFIMTDDPQRKILRTFWYRNNSDSTISSKNMSNCELIRTAIAQFLDFPHILADNVELDTQTTSFEGAVTNRFGRLLLMTSLFPAARSGARAEGGPVALPVFRSRHKI